MEQNKKLILYIPQFAVDAPDYDKIWTTFMWMVGQNYGFDQYLFHMPDYKLITHFAQGTSNRSLARAFTGRFSKWISMGNEVDPAVGRMKFKNKDWTFIRWECEDPRMQRIWIHLYNAVWLSEHTTRQDLFVKENRKRIVPLYGDTQWWEWDGQTNRPADWIPHYLRPTGTYSKTQSSKIKIKEHE